MYGNQEKFQSVNFQNSYRSGGIDSHRFTNNNSIEVPQNIHENKTSYRSTAEEISNYDYISKEKAKMDMIRDHHYESKRELPSRGSPSPVPG